MDSEEKTTKKSGGKLLRVYAIVATVLAVLLMVGLYLVAHRAGYDVRLLEKLGLKEKTTKINADLIAYENCLRKMNYDADIVFFGDVLTMGSNFQSVYTNKKIVNLGFSGKISSLVGRVSMVKAVTPEKIFLNCGISTLTDKNADDCAKQFAALLDKLKEEIPEAAVYVESVLPVSLEKEESVVHNASIVFYNEKIKKIAEERGLVFIDLYALYVKDGALDPSVNSDGAYLHKDGYDRWAKAVEPYI